MSGAQQVAGLTEAVAAGGIADEIVIAGKDEAGDIGTGGSAVGVLERPSSYSSSCACHNAVCGNQGIGETEAGIVGLREDATALSIAAVAAHTGDADGDEKRLVPRLR